MLSEPRTISLIAEFIHIPVVHSAEKLREVYNEVCRTCGYENFLRIQGGARIERRIPDSEGFSNLIILGDRVQMTEDHTGITVDQFGRKISAVLKTVMPSLGIPMLLIQQNKVRVASTPTRHKTAAEFLARKVFHVEAEQVSPLGRPVSFFGFRLLFPPTKDDPANFNLRIESYVRDQRALYIENVATFKNPIQVANLDVAEKNLERSSEFINERVISFLAGYDSADG